MAREKKSLSVFGGGSAGTFRECVQLSRPTVSRLDVFQQPFLWENSGGTEGGNAVA